MGLGSSAWAPLRVSPSSHACMLLTVLWIHVSDILGVNNQTLSVLSALHMLSFFAQQTYQVLISLSFTDKDTKAPEGTTVTRSNTVQIE